MRKCGSAGANKYEKRETLRVISRILHMVNLLDVDYCPRLCMVFRAIMLGANADA